METPSPEKSTVPSRLSRVTTERVLSNKINRNGYTLCTLPHFI